MKTHKEKLIDILSVPIHPRIGADYTEVVADYLLDNDVFPIVRCKDCKHYKEFRTKRNKQIMRLCCRMGKNDMEYSVKPDDFCSYGERKDVIQK